MTTVGFLCGICSVICVAVIIADGFQLLAPNSSLSSHNWTALFAASVLCSCVAAVLHSKWWFLMTGALVLMAIWFLISLETTPFRV